MNLLNLGMIEIGEGIYAKVVKKGACTAEFNRISKAVGGSFRYLGISANEPTKMNGYAHLVKDIKVDWPNENLIIIITNESTNHKEAGAQ